MILHKPVTWNELRNLATLLLNLAEKHNFGNATTLTNGVLKANNPRVQLRIFPHVEQKSNPHIVIQIAGSTFQTQIFIGDFVVIGKTSVGFESHDGKTSFTFYFTE